MCHTPSPAQRLSSLPALLPQCLGYSDGWVRNWSISGAAQLWTHNRHSAPVVATAFSKQGTLLASGA
jgi:hypothetical protein